MQLKTILAIIQGLTRVRIIF